MAAWGPIVVSGFRYATGVAALEIRNAVGRIIILPFQGQQIWDAEFFGRRLTMMSLFPEPVATRDYRATNGAFFVHCGGTAMGNPAPDDNHPLHGELPNLPFDAATIRLGGDKGQEWVEVSGVAKETSADGHVFESRPSLRLAGTGSLVEVGVDMRNMGQLPMPFFYLAHVNFHPMDGASLHDRATAPIMVRPPRLSPDTPEGDRVWHRAVAEDFSHHSRIRAGDRVLPEFVATFAAQDDGDGWAEARQIHPGGHIDIVRQRPKELPYFVRWIVRGDHRQACGFALPGTAAPDGRSAALRNGQVITLEPGESFRTTIFCGAEIAS